MAYKNISDHPTMGMNNCICKNPVAFCRSKRVYLNEEDIKRKKCCSRLTIDLIGTAKCNWLESLHEDEKS